MSIGGAAALAIAPIVMALTGLCRGIGKASVPLPMMVCLPSRTTRQPAFSKARMASLCRMPGILGMDRNVYLGGLDDFALARRVWLGSNWRGQVGGSDGLGDHTRLTEP
jgi:hypothetical protein